ncbi:MAG: aminopeptidase N [Oligoflexales bacterium]
MSIPASKTKYLRDYSPTPYSIPKVKLEFHILSTEAVHVRSEVLFHARDGHVGDTIELHGEHFTTHSATLDSDTTGKIELSNEGLKIQHPPKEFTLKTHTEINPKANTALSGLYLSGTNLFTQCEAEGFRRITWFYDRPDILSVYEVKVTGNTNDFPQLLSNGNVLHQEDHSSGESSWLWSDPWPKPSYLFALVAGNFGEMRRDFTTSSGRQVELSIYAPHKDIQRCEHAMESLIRSMEWDEKIYGLECDLDKYMVVATPDFNFGAMENKGLNVFNSALIYAHPSSCTDQTWQAVEATIGHEYFHNWTGNRVTCRDWFQLCLKEGLTVFRDQEFSADMGDRDVERIKNVQLLREHQFPEDNGPMAHPPRPDHFIEINNFYTATVYEKGAEVIRMIYHLLGKKNFRKGIDLYFERHDGQAVTQEDFIKAMEDASGKNLEQFFLWYTQPGTPTVIQKESWDESKKEWTLTLQQFVSIQDMTVAQPPRHIPVKMGLLTKDGRPAPLNLLGQNHGTQTTLHFTQNEQSWIFTGLDSKPVPSLFRSFSAPIKLQNSFEDEKHKRTLLRHDQDPFIRWDCAQKIISEAIFVLAQGKNIEEDLFDDFTSILEEGLSDAQLGLILKIPSEYELSLNFEGSLESLLKARKIFCEKFTEFHREIFLKHLQRLNHSDLSSMSADAIGRRSLRHSIHLLLTSLHEPSILASLQKDATQHPQMSIVQSALQCLNQWGLDERQEAMNEFYKKWKNDSLLLNSWFSLEASCPHFPDMNHIKNLREHPEFNLQNPNRVRSMVRSFTRQNLQSFHHISGDGYKFIADLLIDLDPVNPQIASGIARSFSHWRTFSSERQILVKQHIQSVLNNKLSNDLYEVLTTIISS